MSQIVFYFLHSTSELSFYIDIGLTLSILIEIVHDTRRCKTFDIKVRPILQMKNRIYFTLTYDNLNNTDLIGGGGGGGGGAHYH